MSQNRVICDGAWIAGTNAGDSLDVWWYNDCTIYGYGGNDYADVYSGNREEIYGGRGNDTVTLRFSNDSRIYGNEDNDLLAAANSNNCRLYGGSGNDTLLAENGKVTLYGEAGNDVIGVCGQSVVYGGAGNDSIVCFSKPRYLSLDSYSSGTPVVYGGAGRDTVYMIGDEVILADMKAGEDTLVFGYGVAYERKLGKDTSNVGAFVASRSGNNLVLTDSVHKVKLTFKGVTDIRSIQNIDVIKGQKNVEGKILKAGTKTKLGKMIKNVSYLPKNVKTSGNNVVLGTGFRGSFDLRKYMLAQKNVTAAGNKAKLSLTGDNSANILRAGSGGNTLYGLGGNDKLYGGKGNDTLYGGDGNDSIYGGVGKDNLQGGNGNDKLYAQSGNNVLNGGAGSDYLEGGTGTDTLRGGSGRDIIKCGKGVDKIQFYKGDGTDTIQGANKSDILYLYNISNIKKQAKFKMSGRNLVMSFTNNKNDSIILSNWSTGGINKFVVGDKTYSIKLSGGKVAVK